MWIEGDIDDATFVQGLQYLIDQNIIVVPPPVELPQNVSSGPIPDWIKRTASMWIEGDIDDATFVQGLQYLIDQNIIVVPPPVELPQNVSSGPIPDWIKRTASMWIEGDIDDATFVQGLQYLIQTGIIQV